jgi:hypothetical protein
MEPTNHSRLTYEKLVAHAHEADRKRIKKVLILYEETQPFIGDCCLIFDKFKYFRAFLNNAAIDVSFSQKQHAHLYEALLRNNPYVDRFAALAWNEINFEEYDIVFCVVGREESLLAFLHGKYGGLIAAGRFNPAVFSFSKVFLVPSEEANCIFPVMEDLRRYLQAPVPAALYISREEQQWAGQWLKDRGLREDDNLFIVCDSTSAREKLMHLTAYFDFLADLLLKKNAKVLIFDENGIGKEEYYLSWMGAAVREKLIVARKQSLREALCLLGSRRVKMIFGPCTGLMHCASGIYNHYVDVGMDPGDVPLIITYTGQYPLAGKGANYWWGASPLVNCLLLKQRDRQHRLTLLSSLSEAEKNLADTLPCSQYTAEMLIGFVNQKLALV